MTKQLEIEIAALVPYVNNARTHSQEQIAQIVASIERFGFTNPVLVDEHNNIIAGHGRIAAAQRMGMLQVPCRVVPGLTEAERRALIIADNKLALNAGWDDALLALELADLPDDLQELTGFTTDELAALLDESGEPEEQGTPGALADRFGVPPFSILDTRKAEWQDRKRLWNELIGDQGESREYTIGAKGSLFADFESRTKVDNKGVSILDAVLAELMCKWFAKPEFTAYDPFAGDSVFGFVACSTGLQFVGIELREEQAKLNQQRLNDAQLSGVYICDTSENQDKHVQDESVDFVFSCPPYADLEQYSNDPRDLSNMSHEEFFRVLGNVLAGTYRKLKNNRFAVIVFSEVRGKKGEYIGIVPQTIQQMRQAGYHFWNEIILINPAGTLPQRAGKSMTASRKVGRTHQNVLVFYKGDPAKIKLEFGEVDAPFNLEEYADEQ